MCVCVYYVLVLTVEHNIKILLDTATYRHVYIILFTTYRCAYVVPLIGRGKYYQVKYQHNKKSDRRTMMVHCKGGTLSVGIAHLARCIITANSSRITVQLLLWRVIISFTFLLLLRVVTCERVWWWWQLYSVTMVYINSILFGQVRTV